VSSCGLQVHVDESDYRLRYGGIGADVLVRQRDSAELERNRQAYRQRRLPFEV
jgi:hypothetical protein